MNRIRALRAERSWRQKDLAELLNTTQQTVARYESEILGLDVETIFRLCDIFGCTADYLLGRSSNPTPEISDADAALLQALHAAPPSVVTAIRALLQPYQQEAGAQAG